MTPTSTPTHVAREFVARLRRGLTRVQREALTADQVRLFDEYDEAGLVPDVCASHDYCDANDVMEEALHHFGVTDVFADDATDLWNDSWKIAARMIADGALLRR